MNAYQSGMKGIALQPRQSRTDSRSCTRSQIAVRVRRHGRVRPRRTTRPGDIDWDIRMPKLGGATLIVVRDRIEGVFP
jgi:hypothetical protein